jgi:hypothetical protein
MAKRVPSENIPGMSYLSAAPLGSALYTVRGSAGLLLVGVVGVAAGKTASEGQDTFKQMKMCDSHENS